ncbi:MAG: hypothetical protein WCF17_03225 [Terracidiphilus sp.]
MEIGPINGFRPVAMVNAAERGADLTGVFAVELRHQGKNAEDSPNQKASRGLEEDDVEDGAAREEERTEVGGAADRTVSFFA